MSDRTALEDFSFMALAVAEAEKHVGATAPNPPVGCVIVKEGRILAIAAHERAGSLHAEAKALEAALKKHGTEALQQATMYVTLEPCNHTGRTPPCTKAIVEARVGRVVFGVDDPNPHVAGGGSAALAEQGIEVQKGVAVEMCRPLIRPFAKRVETGLPWLLHKMAFRETEQGQLTMLPAVGANTFTSPQSLRLAHEERRRSDAFITSVNTILADQPRFTVRHVQDHVGKARWVAVISRHRSSVPQAWLEEQKSLGHEVVFFETLEESLPGLGKRGVNRVLVEAGPTLSAAIIEERLWDERLVFIKRNGAEAREDVMRSLACSLES